MTPDFSILSFMKQWMYAFIVHYGMQTNVWHTVYFL